MGDTADKDVMRYTQRGMVDMNCDCSVIVIIALIICFFLACINIILLVFCIYYRTAKVATEQRLNDFKNHHDSVAAQPALKPKKRKRNDIDSVSLNLDREMDTFPIRAWNSQTLCTSRPLRPALRNNLHVRFSNTDEVMDCHGSSTFVEKAIDDSPPLASASSYDWGLTDQPTRIFENPGRPIRNITEALYYLNQKK